MKVGLSMQILTVNDEFPTVREPRLQGYRLFGSGISGGTFRGYLEQICDSGKEGTAMIAEPVCRRFILPCYDGQGEIISDDEISAYCKEYESCYSDELCCNYIFIPDPATVILYDDERSIREKIRYAEKSGIPIFVIRTALNKKLRLSD